MSKFSDCKKAIKCTCRTINLAKEGHTLEERRCKMLIFEKKPPVVRNYEACAPALELGLKEPHKDAKRFRLCTAEDIKTTCPPPLCSCPPLTAKPKTSFIKLGLKSLIVAAVIYGTLELGIWGTAKQTECVYLTIKKHMFGEHVSCETDGAPDIGRNLYECRQSWNRMITFIFQKTVGLFNTIEEASQPEQDCPSETKK